MDILTDLDKCLTKVLFACLKTCTYEEDMYNANVVYNNPYLKNFIKKEYGITAATVNNSITKLAKKEILIKKEKGVYILNPTLFWKGRISKRTKATIKAIKQPEKKFKTWK